MLSPEPASATTTPHESHPSADQPTSDDVEAQAGGTLGGDASLDPLAAVANTARATLTPEAMLQRTRGLRLRTLTVNGFKSFADKTEFAFNESVVGIVGPNGCGKSNVVDAIKWVLGERSSKSLRGKEMIDVIFAGSAGRKPSGMAGVTLAFDNPLHSDAHQDALAAAASEQVGDERGDEHAEAAAEAAAIVRPGAVHRPLPVDTDVVEVERRLYRDGKSQYLINGKLARLKDIRELFLDTGIGADAYSIIEQGKVDAMLLASPTERRAIFEEAAGIAKYRLRRVEAERKLDRTEGNLVRTREQLASTERRLRIVRGQAAKARRYTEIKDEHDALRLALAFEQYDDLRKRLEGLTSQLGSLEARRRETAGLLREAEEAAQEGELRLHELSDERRRLEQERTEGAHRRERAQQRREMALRAIEEAAQQASSEAERLHDAGERITALDSEVEQLSLALEALRTRHEASERELDEATAARAEAMGSISERRAALDRARRDTAQIERERTTLLAQREAEGKREASLSEQASELRERGLSLDTDHAEAIEAGNSAREQREAREAESASLRSAIAALDARAGSLGEGRTALAGRVASLDEERVRLDSRRRALVELVESRAGLGEATRAVLDRSASGDARFAGVVGSLAELIETDADGAHAVETSLGERLQAVVIRSRGDLPSHDALGELPGRVMFLPLGDEQSAALARSVPVLLSARVRRVRDMVRAVGEDSGVAALLDRLLGGTALVDSLDTALLLGAGPMAGWAFITSAGEVVSPDGSVVGGPAASAESAGLLARRAELDELDASLESIESQLAVKRDELRRADADAAELERERTAHAEQLAGGEREALRAQNQQERFERDAERLERERTGLRERLEGLEVRVARLARERAEIAERAERLGRLHEEQASGVERLEGELREAESAIEQLNERQGEAKVELGKLGEQLNASARELGRLGGLRDDAEWERDTARERVEEARTRVSGHEEAVRSAESEANEAGEIEQAAHAALEATAGTLDGMREAVGEHRRAVQTRRETAEHVERDWHAIETSRRELEVKRESVEERTSEDLGIDLGGEYADYREVMDTGNVRPVDTTESQARVNVLRSELKKLGPINLESIDEEGQLEGRNETLIAQVRDLDEARVKLATLIETLNIASRDRFGEVFERIREEFGGRDGLFRRLFGGGRAEVRLMPLVKEIDGQKVQTDEIDLLESGVEVIAKPPGKEPRSISQLSGGEKTLTAVALLMSIFRSKPSCFCILDEVDAALDEANVARFCGTLEQFTDHSRFIVITHNKRTMRSVDRLYGVTMQERGVSKRVSVKFDQVDAKGNIATDTQPARDAAPDSPLANGADRVASPEPKKPSLRKALAAMREDSAATSDHAKDTAPSG